MAVLLPPTSLEATSWFCFAAFLLTGVIVYVAADHVARKYRVFAYLMCFMALTSAVAHLVMAATRLGYVLVEDATFYWVYPALLMATVPVLLLSLALFSGATMVESLFLASINALQYVCFVFCGLHPQLNRWMFFIAQLVLFIPIAQALLGGFKAQAEAKFDHILAARASHFSSLFFMYFIVQELFLLLTHCIPMIAPTNEGLAISLADFFVKFVYSMTLVSSRELIVRSVDGHEALSLLSGGAEHEAEGEMETGVAGKSFRVSDVMHMKPAGGSEKTPLRGQHS